MKTEQRLHSVPIGYSVQAWLTCGAFVAIVRDPKPYSKWSSYFPRSEHLSSEGRPARPVQSGGKDGAGHGGLGSAACGVRRLPGCPRQPHVSSQAPV